MLLTFRLWWYREKNFHYFLFDFCYFTNILLLIYLWLIPPGPLAGNMFVVVFCFANGPVLWAIAFWRNSLVFHSVDKMTSLFIHVSPALTVTTLKWLDSFSTLLNYYILLILCYCLHYIQSLVHALNDILGAI